MRQNDDVIRWTVTVSKDTDIAVRSFLAQRGFKKGDLSKFIEEAVKWRVFDQTVVEVSEKFADLPPDELQAMIDEATEHVRQDMFPKKGHKVLRVVIDTNVLISGLLIPTSSPALLLTLWREGRFDLLTAESQIEEIARVTRYPKIRERLKPALAGRLLNELRDLAVMVTSLPPVDISPDPYDNYLLSIASGGQADCLITGDKRDLLSIQKYAGTLIISVTAFLKSRKK